MKQRLLEIAGKIDALSLRERVILFAAAVSVMLFLVNFFLIDPQFARQKKLADQIGQDQQQMQQVQAMIEQKIRAQTVDPDAEARARLQQVKRQQTYLQGELLDMQKGLVSPEKMAGLLEDMLKRQGKLRLLSLKTLPVAGLNEAPADELKAKAPKAKAEAETPALADKAGNGGSAAPLYKHGVEITLQGSYPDMLDYMAALEKMPWQLFWGKAELQVQAHPAAVLTLTLFTLSLDKKWLNL